MNALSLRCLEKLRRCKENRRGSGPPRLQYFVGVRRDPRRGSCSSMGPQCAESSLVAALLVCAAHPCSRRAGNFCGAGSTSRPCRCGRHNPARVRAIQLVPERGFAHSAPPHFCRRSDKKQHSTGLMARPGTRKSTRARRQCHVPGMGYGDVSVLDCRPGAASPHEVRRSVN